VSDAFVQVIGTWNGWRKPLQFTVWGVLFWINLVIVVGLIVVLVATLRRDRVEKPAANLVPFLQDDDLEGPRLERVLGWALFFLAVLALAYPLYWLRESAREKASTKYFDKNSIERGEALFSNALMPKTFNPASSLQCANCHGVAGSGGSGAPYTYSDPNTGLAYSVTWKAPALNTVLYRFSPTEVHDIIEYGRPGTPMQPWGVLGGGPKNEQSISDLISYLTSIQLPPGTNAQAAADVQRCRKGALPTTALGQTACALDEARTQADDQLTAANKALSDAMAAKTADQASYAEKKCATTKPEPGDPNAADCSKLKLELFSYNDPASPVDPKALAAAKGELKAADTEAKTPTQVTDLSTAKFDLKAANAAIKADNKAWKDKHCNTKQESAVDAAACKTLDRALHTVQIAAADDTAISTARSNDTWAQQWEQRRAGVTDGQLLFETNCARCHTQNWSIFDPTNAQLTPEELLGPPGGNGSLGFNLRDGGEVRRFPDTRDPTGNIIPHSGILSQIMFVANGSDPNVAYGKGGIGSGRMPGQCNTAEEADATVSLPFYGCMMTQASNTNTSKYVPDADPTQPIDNAMIEQIVQYERCGLDLTNPDLKPPLDYSNGCN
jgi:mono/diheme cytochrome c family protein